MITRAQVEALGQITSAEWPIISLFLRIDKERIDEDYTIRLKNLLSQAAEELDDDLSHDQVEAVKEDLGRIRDFIRDNHDQYGEGIAIFASSRAGIWQVYETPKDIESSISIGFTTEVAPLIHVLEEIEPFCTCLIARNQARIFYGRLGDFTEIGVERSEDVPGQHDQGGWSQARYERHIEEHVRAHFKSVADQLYRVSSDQPFRFLVLGGPDEVVAAFTEYLHPYLRERHVVTIRSLMEANLNDVHAESWTYIQRWLRGEQQRYLDTLLGEAHGADMGVLGLDKTIEAVQQGQVLTLIVDDTLSAPGATCRSCGAVQPTGAADHQECVYCGGPLYHLRNVVPTLVTTAYRQSANIVYLDDAELRIQLEPHGRIGALLRYRATSPTS